MKRPTLGVMGGMGTQATACFYEMLHDMQTVSAEQEYLDVLVYSMPSIPDRSAFIIGSSDENPLTHLLFAAKTLEAAGVCCIAMPCVTAHFFYGDIAEAASIPILNMPEETARSIAAGGLKRVGLLATVGTLKSRFFHAALEKSGIEVIVPPANVQAGVMEIVYEIKRGGDVAPEALDAMAAGLAKSGAEAVVLGCTELSLLAKGRPGYVNAMEALALASLEKCKLS